MNSNTNKNLYETFIVAYETLNLYRTAEIMNVTRSAVGQKIKELGGQLGVKLFIPHAKGITPTREADMLYPKVKNAMDSIVETENALREFANNEAGAINMAVHTWYIKHYLDKYLIEFCAKYPKVQIKIFHSEGLNLLQENKVDFQIDLDSLFENTSFKTIRIIEKPFTGTFFATKQYLEKHGLSQTSTREEVLKHPLIIRSEIISRYEKALGVDRIPLHIKVPTNELQFPMVNSHLGIACGGSAMLPEFNNPDVVELEIVDRKAPIQHIMVCGYKTLSRPARAFVEGLAKFGKS